MKSSGNRPPEHLDGAIVIEWFYSTTAFSSMIGESGKPIECHGQAICRYQGSDIFYRFTCTRDWEVIADTDYSKIEDAKATAYDLYEIPTKSWIPVLHKK